MQWSLALYKLAKGYKFVMSQENQQLQHRIPGT